MKKTRPAVALILVCIFLFSTGCSPNNDTGVTHFTDELGNFVIESQGSRTVMIHDLPYNLSYNESQIPLVSVDFYENTVDYSHNLFIVTTLDISNLDDQQLHWLRESDLEVHAYLTSDDNDYDFTPAPALGNLLITDAQQLIFVNTSSFSKENRYSFAGSELSLRLDATQKETYEYTSDSGNTSKLHTRESLHYQATIGTDISSPDEIPEPLSSYIIEWLYG